MVSSDPASVATRTTFRSRHVENRLARAWSHVLAPLAVLVPALALYGVFMIWPIARMGILSLSQWDGFSKPSYVGLNNFAELMNDPGFPTELEHTLLWISVTLSVPMCIGLLLALLLQSVPVSIRSPARALLFIPLLLPSVAIAVVWRLFYNPVSGPLTNFLTYIHAGWLDRDWLGDPGTALPALLVAACWGSFGFSMLICEAGLARISQDVLAAARLDGAGNLAQLWALKLPALRGMLPLAVLATAFCAIPSYDLNALLTNGGPGYATTTLALDGFDRAFGGTGQIGVAATLSILQSSIGLALAVITLLIARRVEHGEWELDETRRQRNQPLKASINAGILFAASLIVLAPLAWLCFNAGRTLIGVPTWSGLASNVAYVWDAGFGSAIGTSLWTSSVVSVCSTMLAIVAAFAIGQVRLPVIRAIVLTLLVLGLFQPIPVLIFPIFDTVRSLGLLNTLAGMIGPQIGRALAICVLFIWLGLRAVPRVLLEAAAIDGTSPLKTLIFIALPLLWPVLLVTSVWSFLLSWDDYLTPNVILAGGDTATAPLTLAHYIGRFDTQYGLLATGALMTMVPVALIFVTLNRPLTRGLTWLAM